ncbi:MAG: hypothetical protein Q8R36_04125 [bacterium]|nr:hypothetical protein [bacterium]
MNQNTSQPNPITQGPYSKRFVIWFLIVMVLMATLTSRRFFVKHDFYVTKNPTVIDR